jgi:hypothetical protein
MSPIGFLVICHISFFSDTSPIIVAFSVIWWIAFLVIRQGSIFSDTSPVIIGFSMICQSPFQ